MYDDMRVGRDPNLYYYRYKKRGGSNHGEWKRTGRTGTIRAGVYRDNPKYDSMKWIPASNVGFYNQMSHNLGKIRNDKRWRIKLGRIGQEADLFPYQKVVGEYMKHYRGLLVNHKLGSGKSYTATSIINMLKKNVIILLPGALRSSWKTKYIEKFLENTNDDKHNFYVKFLTYNAPNLINQYQRLDKNLFTDINALNAFDNHLIIIEESHEFFQNVISGKATQALTIFKKLINAKGLKILCLTGTPIVGDPFEIAQCANLLRGKINGKYLLFPTDHEEFYKYFVTEDRLHIKNPLVFGERITGLVSYYGGTKDLSVIPRSLPFVLIEKKMGKIQWQRYLIVKKEESDMERKMKFLKKGFKVAEFKKPTRASIGTYKVKTSKVSSFAYPPDVEKLYSKIKELFLIPNDSHVGKSISYELWDKIRKSYKLKDRYGRSPPRKHEVAEIKWYIMINLYSFTDIKEKLSDLSCKIDTLLNNITDRKKHRYKMFIYSKFKVLGTRLIGEILKLHGYEYIKNITDFRRYIKLKHRSKRFIIIDGDTKKVSEFIALFNHYDNRYGGICQFVLGTQVMSKGISLRCVRETHILEPQWRDVTLEQIRGRAERTHSHKALKPEERTTQTFLYIALPNDRSELLAKLGGIYNDETLHSSLTTDEFLYKNAKIKAKFHQEFLAIIRSHAIDCGLYDNIIKCYKCPPDIVKMIKYNKRMSLFPPDYKEHIIHGPVCAADTSEIDVAKNVKLELIKDNLYRDEIGKVYALVSDLFSEKKEKRYEEIGYMTDDGYINEYT